VQLGTQVFDIPAQVHPGPYPDKADGVVRPHYPVNYRQGAPRLIYCQDRDHVPLPAESVYFEGNFIKSSKQSLPWGDQTFPRVAIYDVRRSELFRRTWPLANALAVERWSLIERRVDSNGILTAFRFEDGEGRSARVRCIDLNTLPPKLKRMGPVCDTDVAIGEIASFIRFRPGKTNPRDYPMLINTAATAVSGLRHPGGSSEGKR
jgi:hypothetical protein